MTQLLERSSALEEGAHLREDVPGTVPPGRGWNGILLAVLGAVALALVALTVVWPHATADLWWQLKTGELNARTGAVPHVDPFSHTVAGHRWVVVDWLTDLLLYRLHSRFGAGGLLFFQMAVLVAAFALVLGRCWSRTREPLIAIAVTVLAAYAARPWLDLQAGTVSTLFLSLELLLLEGWRSGRCRRGLWAIPAVMGLWANCHASFLLGLGILLVEFLVTLGESVGSRQSAVGSKNGASGLPTAYCRLPTAPGWRTLAGVLGASLLAGLLSPSHVLAYLALPGFVLSHVLMLHRVTVWPSPNFHEVTSRPCEILLILALLGRYLSPRPRAAVDTLLVGGCVVAALYSTRHIPLFAIVCAPIVADELAASLREEGKRQKAKGKRQKEGALRALLNSSRSDTSLLPFALCLLPFAFATLALLGLMRVEWQRLPSRDWARWSMQLDTLPRGAATFLREHPGSGKLFNEQSWGSYFLACLGPEQKVFVDDRTELYCDEGLCREYRDILNTGRPGWAGLLQERKIDTVVVKPDAWVAVFLPRAPGWALVYRDSQAVVIRQVKS